jgi:DNA-binding transcriptional ArsR family regulator
VPTVADNSDDSGQIPLRALASPVRLRILSLVTGAPMSAAEVARELDIAHASASYHLRQLYDAGLVYVAEERVIRGGQERRYSYDPRGGYLISREAAALAEAAILTELQRRLGTNPRRRSVSDTELWVDPQVWDDVVNRVTKAMAELEASAQRPRTPGTQHVSATSLLLEFDVDDAAPSE